MASPSPASTSAIPTILHDNEGKRARIEAKTREVLALPAVPILLGGDCSTTFPFLAGFADHGPIWILQIDAHIDWRDEVHGERDGACRRHGAGRPAQRRQRTPAEIDAARAFGSRFVTAREVHAEGVEAALRHIPNGARVVIALDCDGLDPGIMPGVAARTPGGLTSPR